MNVVTLRYTVAKLCYHKTEEYKSLLNVMLTKHMEYLNALNMELSDINVVIQYMVQLDMQLASKISTTEAIKYKEYTNG